MNAKIKVFGISALLGAFAFVNSASAGFPEAKVTVHVLSESGNDLSGAKVRLGFKDRFNPEKESPVEGITDGNGLFTGEGQSDSVIGSSVQKEGYYDGWAPIATFREADQNKNRWLPWNPTIVTVLRKIEHRVAMYVRHVTWLEVPVVGEPCGFDLEVSDWVPPYGRGKLSDIVVTLSRRYVDRRNFDVSAKIAFSNVGDGIQPVVLPPAWRMSKFKWPRIAPDADYEPSLVSQFGVSPNSGLQGTSNDRQAYFIRVRTVYRDGKIVSALYGKIDGGIGVDGRDTKTGALYFTYYLNPTSLDRNLEWDTTRNLISGLKVDETPRDP